MSLPDPDFLRKLGAKILKWWSKNKRDYPWRHETDPYRILIAEIMLQRTKADQVVPVYLEFIKRYPTIKDLGRANLEDIEYFFNKLGLKWRAKRVLEMAKYIAEKFDGKLPAEKEYLLEIPMIGEYISDAILSFAYGLDVAVIDANVVRVIGRLLCLEPHGEARRDPRFRNIAGMMLPRGRAREYNWAMIDFAALICTPRNPRCDICPLRNNCCFFRRSKTKV